FAFPAMSPTMDIGGLVDWKVKEGQAYQSGQVLLEVETDKAQIDVEAQDDGILAKILVPAGTKDIPVGKTIAWIAEPDDDLSTLKIPESEPGPESASKALTKSNQKASSSADKSEKMDSKSTSETPNQSIDSNSISTSNTANSNQTFFPSVSNLLSENNISRDDALAKIKASGPNGRILKGDVLVYLGKASKDSLNKLNEYIHKHDHLDLSNIVATPIKLTSADSKDSQSTAPAPVSKPKPQPIILSQTYNLSTLIELQKQSIGKVKPFTISEYINEASKKSESLAYQKHAINSDYYDELFEDLVTPSNIERFQIKNLKINYSAISNSNSTSKPSIFDLLTQNSNSSNYSAQPTVEVELLLNDKVGDAKEKANIYLQKLGEFLQPEL
ncbi:Pdx1p ASCRUDRAFT_34697, partial [Ascoidea rubescens DSM 1968]